MIAKGLKGITAAETKISFIDGEQGVLVYRGHEARKLAEECSFEEVCYLLWHKRLPSREELSGLEDRMREARVLPQYIRKILDMLPSETGFMEALRTAVSALGAEEYGWKPTTDQSAWITGMIPSIIAYYHHTRNGTRHHEPRADLSHVENYLFMLSGQTPDPVHARALEAYMILGMEHGLNASTFSARVISSSESDLVSAVCGAIGTMKGPLHGGAPSAVTAMLDEIGCKERAEDWLRGRLERGEKLMGFGHRVYRTQDPRAVALSSLAEGIGRQDKWLDLARYVEGRAIRLLAEYKPGRRLYTNVEFYAAAVMRAIRFDADLFTPTFTAARTAGWCAHVLEQAEDNAIYRPEAAYTGTFHK
ncbi:citrate/2-methylcitrate synthase [Peribacillus sp. SCS-26]|uniref:citrate/2-methylcitrate synthase n=1 Tax=Paraperibacillus marinus TaxID=3115295 RepID=UPI003905B9BE